MPSLEGSAPQLALGQHGHRGHLPRVHQGGIIPQKLDFNINGSYSVNQPNEFTMRCPAFDDGYARLDATLQHHFTNSLAIDQKDSWTQIVGVTLKYKFE